MARTNDAQSTLPVLIEQVDLVRVEKSLHSLGFFACANRDISRTIIQVFRRPNGQKIHAKALIEGVPSLGLPTTADRDKYMAFMKIALDQREFQGQVTNPVRFSGADMIKLLRLRKGGFHYDEINDWCKRMVATTITSEASIFLADKKQYASDTFHVFDRVVLVGEELNDGSRSDFYQIHLSQWQLTNLNQGYLLPLDFNAYLNLKRDIAKALFGHLSVWFYASRGQAVEKKYVDLCQLLNIRAYPHLSKARSVLEPSLTELTEIGYLSSWELIRTARGTDFKLMMAPGKRLLGLPNFSSLATPEARAALEAKLPSWVPVLIEKGVAERKARQLALDIADEQPVLDQIEYAELLIGQSGGKISNPAGFFVWAIESNLPVPKDFETSRRIRLREAQRHSDREARNRMLELEMEYQLFYDAQLEMRVEADYPADRLEEAIREQTKEIKREQPEWFSRMPEQGRRQVALNRLKREVRKTLSVPSFETWKKEKEQRLF